MTDYDRAEYILLLIETVLSPVKGQVFLFSNFTMLSKPFNSNQPLVAND